LLLEDTQLKVALLEDRECAHYLKRLDLKKNEIKQKQQKLQELTAELARLRSQTQEGIDIDVFERVREWRRSGSPDLPGRADELSNADLDP